MPHGELLVPGLILLVVGLALVTVARFWPQSRPVVTTVATTEPLATTALTGPVVPSPRASTWPRLIDPDAGDLDESDRAHVIEGLGIVGDAWSAEILARAFDEEEGDLRVAVIEALGQCDAEIVKPTLERAYDSYLVDERYAAIDGASRRAEIPLLERALRDPDATVALAAAYGLFRAHRKDLIDADLSTREDPGANEIRRVLPILAYS